MQGMGEPMNNYNALVEAIGVFTGSPFQLSPKRITVSTVEVLPFVSSQIIFINYVLMPHAAYCLVAAACW
jgi:adenine C2-methylase RlmN of 23S rRNA A2503 and tRNA A37